MSDEHSQSLAEMRRKGYTLDSPPNDFEPPVSVKVAAGYNILPGIGNFYLANHGGGRIQWYLGIGNFLLWPLSPIWSVGEGYIDATTLNKRALAIYGKNHPELQNNTAIPKEPAEETHEHATAQSQQAVDDTAPQVMPRLYDSIQKTYKADGTVEIRIKVHDTSRTFDIDKQVNPVIRDMFRQEFKDNNPDCLESEIHVISRWETDLDGEEMVYTGEAFTLRPEMAEGTSYDAATRRGKLRIRVVGRISPDSLRDYVRKNISAIVADKNVVLEAGQSAPLGAKYQSLNEKFENDILTVEFMAVE